MLQVQGRKPSVITSDLCIIEEQPEHVVVAIRVPRARIAANMPFLQLLTGQTIPHAPEPDPPRSRTNLLYSSALVTVAFVIGLFMPPPTEASLKPPLEYGQLALASPYSNDDNLLRMTLPAKRNRHCTASAERMVRNLDANYLAWTEQVHAIHLTTLTDAFVERPFAVKLPDLDKGRHEFKAVIHSRCSDKDYHTVIGPIEFLVVD